MTYTDEDILDLCEELKSVGMAETDGEAAVRHLKAFLAQDYLKDLALYMTPDQDQAFRMMADFLEGKGIPFHYCSATVLIRGKNVDTRSTFPLILLKGKIIEPLYYIESPDYLKESNLPDKEFIIKNSDHFQVYNRREEVPKYQVTSADKPIYPAWEIKPWEREDWEIKPLAEY
jgi:hypothetical protein